MLFDLPGSDELYRALIDRDERFDGQAFVCVATTGIFCRLTCPARKPKAENCTFFGSIGECIDAGFRACKRCHPMRAAASADPTVVDLLDQLDKRPGFRWTEDELVRLGHDPSTVRRSFKRHFGMTFLEMARQRRIREGFESLLSGEKVIAAQFDASFESPTAFRTAFARLLGCAPSDLKTGGQLQATWISTPLGDMLAVSSANHLHLLEFVDRKALPTELKRLSASTNERIGLGRLPPSEQVAQELADYFAGRLDQFTTPLALSGSEFTRSVWEELRRIPPGETRSYGDIARTLGRPSAVRAVARANGANQIALLIPCHRVIGADGSLTGYGGGLWRKQRLIEIEQQLRAARTEQQT